MVVSLLARLAELIESWQECLELAALTRNPSASVDRHLSALVKSGAAKSLHRDHGIAALSALTAGCAVMLVCVFWIATAWPDGAVAAGLAAVACSLFAAFDDPSPAMITLVTGIVMSIPLVAIYQFGILPAIDGYTALVVCLAPALIPIGIAMAIPKYTLVGLAFALGMSVLLALQPSYKANMAVFLNSATAVVIGGCIGIAVTLLARSIGAQTSARRLVRAGWRDLADLADQVLTPTRAEWASRMLDRVGLLVTRIGRAAGDLELEAADTLRDLRTGINIVDLQPVVASLSADGRAAMARVLAGIAAYFRDLARGVRRTLGPELLDDMDRLIGDILAVNSPSRRNRGLAAVVGLRQNLYPDAPPYRLVPAAEGTA
jgi:uncharacterized membrane protein YccC